MKVKAKNESSKIKQSMRKQKGITLIALIITIVILIILATISINIIFGNEGLIKRAEQAKELHEQGASGESEMLNQTDEYLWQKIEKEPKPEVEYTNVYATLYEDGILGFSNNEEKIEGLTPVEGKTWNITDEEYSCEWKSDEEIIATTPWFGDRENIEKITFTNEIVPKNVAYLFIGLTNLNTIEKIENFNVTKTNSLFYTFAYCSNVTSIDLSKFNTSSITNMMGLFVYCNNLTTIKFGGKFDTSNVTNMVNMFRNCSALKSIDLSELDTSNVTNMGSLFMNCDDLTTIEFGGKFDTSNVTGMDSMFRYCKSIEQLDISSFDASNVEGMSVMFDGCTNLKSIKFGDKFNTNNVINMTAMFQNCTSLTKLDISSFNTSKVTQMRQMFYGCPLLTTITVGEGWTTNLVEHSTNMFTNCKSLVGENGTVYDSAHTDKEYARIDEEGAPGYLTSKI